MPWKQKRGQFAISLILFFVIPIMVSTLILATASLANANGPVAYYLLDETYGTAVVDASGNSNNGTAVNGVLMGQGGKVGTAFSFDGVNDYVSVPHNASLNITGTALTLQAWVYPRSGTGQQIFVNKEYGYEMGIVNGKFQFCFMSGGVWKSWYGSTALTLNQWQHVAVSYDGAAARFYVNGMLREMVAASGGIDAGTQPLGLGGRIYTGSWISFFNGRLDEVKVWNRALTYDEVWAEAGRSGPVGQAAYYRLDEVSGTAVGDASGNGNTGTAVNGVLINQGGQVGTAFSFDGVNDYVSVPNSASLNITGMALTLEAWVYPRSGTGQQIFVNKEYAYEMGIVNGKFQFTFMSGGVWKSWYGSTALTLNQWQHVAVSYDGAAARFYVDGMLKETVVASGGIDASTQPLGLGGRINTGSWTSFFNGKLDEVKVWSRVLNDAEVVQETGILTPTTASLPMGTVGQGYSTTLSVTGGTAPYSWSVTGGSLPSGLSLSPTTGVISGTPTTTGISSFTVTVTDATGATASKNLSITVNASPAITTTSLPNGVVGSAYSAVLQATGGTAPLTWSVVWGALPSGLVLSGSTILGTPTVAGTSSFIVEVRDANGAVNSLSLTITMDVAPLVITTSSLPEGTVGNPYSATLAASGGVSPYTWSIFSGSLPPGLSLNSTTGVISGNPISSGTVSFIIQVMDGQGSNSQKALSIAISSGLAAYYRLDEVSGTAVGDASGNSSAGTAVNGVLIGQAGKLGAAFSFDGVNDYVSVPHSSSLNITGTALTLEAWVYPRSGTGQQIFVNKEYAYEMGIVNGKFQFTFMSGGVWKNWYGSTALTLNQWQHVAVNYDGAAARFYVNGVLRETVAVSGGIDASTQPLGLGGRINAGIWTSFFNGLLDEVKVWNRVLSDTEVTKEATVLTLTMVLPMGTVGQGYSTTLTATGGTAPYSWSVTGGSLPSGLSLATSTGVISGTPTTAGISSLTVTVTDTVGATASKNLSITVNASPAITTTSLPNGVVGSAYSPVLQTTGGTAPLTWSVVWGALPSGLFLSGSTILGTPTVAGTSSFIVEVRDANGATATQSLSITMDVDPLTITTSSLPGGTVGSSYSATLAASGGLGPYTWSIFSGSLLPGLSLNSTAGVISGIPTSSGTVSFTIQVMDGQGAISQEALSITISSGLAAYYRLDEISGTVVGDASGNNNTGTAVNGVLIGQAGKLGAAFSFDGVNDYVSVPHNTTLNSNTLTLSAWIKPANVAQNSFLVTKRDPSGNYAQYSLGVTGADSHFSKTGKKIAFLFRESGTIERGAYTTADIVDGNWHHVAAVANQSAGTIAIYIDGTPAAITVDHNVGAWPNTATTQTLMIGQNNGSGLYFNGLIDELKIYGRALTATEVAQETQILSPSTVSLPMGTVGQGYSTTLSATGGTAPYSWAVTGGSLPSGLSLATATGVISGTPTTTGISSFTVTVTDATGATASKDLSITVNALPAITTTSLPNGVVGSAYSAVLQATGGTAPLTWSVVWGALPSGLVLSGATIMGTPTVAGTSSLILEVRDANGGVSSLSLTITMDIAPLVITTSSLSVGTVGSSYSATLSASGGISPYTWSIFSGSLLPGLSLNSTAGVISGIPTSSGTVSFTIQVMDGQGSNSQKALSIAISSGLAAYYRLDEISGTVVGDASGNNNTGTAVNGVLIGQAGKLGAAFSFDGVNDYVSVPHNTTLNSNTLTLSAWIKPANVAQNSFLVTKRDPSGNYAQYSLGVTGTDSYFSKTGKKIAFLFRESGTIERGAYTTADIVDGNWHHVAVVANQSAGTIAIYIDGMPAAITVDHNVGAWPNTATTQTLMIGQNNGSGLYFNGLIDELKIYGRALTATEVAKETQVLSPTTVSLPMGTVGQGYSTMLSATGGTAPYSWSMTGGSLPSGLSLATFTGVISGTPTTGGGSNFTVTVTDATGATASKNLSITVNASPAITTTSLPNGVVGSAYSAVLQATGGTAPMSWSVVSGALPSGLVLSGFTILGTPTVAGTSSFIVEVRDANGATATQSLSITMDVDPLTITTSSLTGGTVGSSYSATLAASGGVSPYTWAITAGGLPPGLSLIPSSGIISGTPTVTGDYTFTSRVSDSLSISSNREFTITIVAIPVRIEENDPAIIYIGSWRNDIDPKASGGSYKDSTDANTPASATLTFSGTGVSWISDFWGNVGIAWVYIDGVLDATVDLYSATGKYQQVAYSKSGLSPGTHTLRIEVSGTKNASSTDTLIDIDAFEVIPTQLLTIFTSTLPGGTINEPYTAGISAIGGTPPLTWSVVSGAMPSGLFLSGSTILGTPTVAGTSSFIVEVRDANGASASQGMMITVDPTTLRIEENDPAITYVGSWRNDIDSKASGGSYKDSTDANTPAGATLTFNGTGVSWISDFWDNVGIAWVYIDGVLDATVDLYGATGKYQQVVYSKSGLSPGTHTIRIEVSGTKNVSSTDTFIDIDAFEVIPTQLLTILSSALPNGTITRPYTAAITASGGTPPLTWSISSGSLPAGLVLDGATGSISGTPTNVGTTSFTVQVTDATAATSSRALTLTINPAPVITTTSLPNGSVGVSYNVTLTVSGGTAPYTWAVSSGSLPAGLSLNGAKVTGTPTTTGTYSFTIQVTDANAAIGGQGLSLKIDPPPLVVTTTSVPNGTVAKLYTATISASGGTPPLTWSLSSGSLPAGLALDGAIGSISGTPTNAGTTSFTAQVTDTSGATSSRTISLTINPSPVITTTSLPNGSVGVPYNVTMTVSGGTAPYTWAVSSGSLPPGLSLNSATITGTPTATGTSTFTIRVTDAYGTVSSQNLSLTIDVTPLGIDTSLLPNGTVGSTYRFVLSANGGTPGYSWGLTSGTLPAGLTLSSTGILTGTPSSSGTAIFTIQVMDATGRVASQAFSMTVNSSGTWATGMEGYASLTSVTQGRSIDFSISTGAASYDINIYREGASRQLITTINGLPGRSYAIPANGSQAGYAWPVAYTLTVPSNWRSGIYIAEAASGSLKTEVFFVVKEDNPGSTSNILWKLTVNTYEAYNDAGGKSVYDALSTNGQRAYKVSFERPHHSTKNGNCSTSYSGGSTPVCYENYFYDWEIKFVKWLESNGYTVEYATDVDLHGDPNLLRNYRLLLSVGHDEYWSKEMRDQVENFVDNGGNVAFLSANVAWWQVRYENTNHVMVCYKDYTKDPLFGVDNSRVTYYWYAYPVNRPENTMAGLSWRYGGFPSQEGGYTVYNSSHWVFQGTGISDQQQFGFNEKIVAFELDGTQFDFVDGIPWVTGSDATPLQFVILGLAPSVDWSDRTTPRHATMGMFTKNGGGTVFHAGTANWVLGLSTDFYTQQITKNVLDKLSQPVELSPRIVTESIRPGNINQSYKAPVIASGGGLPYIWTLSSGNLPVGLSLDPSTGEITGTPTSSGSYSFTIQVKDANSLTYTKSLSISINAIVRYEENSSAITYNGSWTNWIDSKASGGSFKSSTDASTPASATLTFTGTGVSWISDFWSNDGIAWVYIDGVLDATVDLYSATGKYQQVAYSKSGLFPGTHTLRIEVSGTKNASSTDTFIDIDAFDVSN